MKNKIIKILFVLHNLEIGGAQKVMTQLINYLDGNHFVPVLVLFNKEGEYLKKLQPQVKIYDLKKNNRWDFFTLIYRLSRIIDYEKPAIILSFLMYENFISLLSRYFSKEKPKIIISERNPPSIAIRNERTLTIKKLAYRCLYPKADKVISVSEGVRDDLQRVANISSELVTVIYNPLDLNDISFQINQALEETWYKEQSFPVIINVGTLKRQKAHTDLIKAFAKVRKVIPCRLIIVGEGKERRNLENLIVELGLSDDIRLIGSVKNPYPYLIKSKIFVLSSHWEGFPNALIEAMACGVPVISFNCPYGPDEIIANGVNGILVNVGDIDGLAKAMLTLLKNNNLMQSLKEEAIKRCAHFDTKVICRQYIDVFHKLLGITI